MSQNVPAVPDDPLVGTVIADRYRILAPLARGGMGRVYRAMQLKLDREVAVKVLDAERDVDSSLAADFTRRFMLEAASLAKLKHPNTTVIHDYGEAGDGRYFIAMELLEGRTLREVIHDEVAVDPERTIRYGIAIASSLTEAHDAGLIHRDLKPGNIFLTKRGDDDDFVKVLDFGLVKKEKSTDQDFSSTGQMVGTPRYMAPEQILGSTVSAATDVYGLGATLYHALTGQPPFDSKSHFELLVKVTDEPPPPPSEIRPEAHIPAKLEAVVLRCLRKKPEDRYASMRDVSAALISASAFSGAYPMASMRVTSGKPVPVGGAVTSDDEPSTAGASGELQPTKIEKHPSTNPVSGVTARASGSSAKPASEADPSAPPESPSQVIVVRGSNRALGWIAGGALLLSAIAVGFVVWQSSRAEPEPTSQPETPPATAPEDPGAEPAAPSARQPATEEPSARANDGRVRVTTHPEGAHIERDGVDVGNAPVVLLLEPGESTNIAVSHRGYRARTVAVTGGQETLHVRLERRRTRPNRPATAPTTRPSRTDNRNPWDDP